MNAFSKDYRSAIDWSDVSKDHKLSAKRTAQRQAQLNSDDPEERRKANLGYVGRTEKNVKLLGNSFT